MKKQTKVVPMGGRTPEVQKEYDLYMLKSYDVDYMAQKMLEYDLKNGKHVTQAEYDDEEKRGELLSYYTDEAQNIHDDHEPHDILCILEEFMLGLANINEMCGQAIRVPQCWPMSEKQKPSEENRRIEAELTAQMNQW